MGIINLKELGIPYIVAKAKNKRYMQIFLELGANKVVRTEKEMGEQVAKSVLGKNIIDIVDLDSEYSIVEIPTPKQWVGKSLIELDLRRKYGINVVGIRGYLEEHLNVCPDAEYRIEACLLYTSKRHHTSIQSVERTIRVAIEITWLRGDMDEIMCIFHNTVDRCV